MTRISVTTASRSVVGLSLLIGLLAVSFSSIFIEWSKAPAAIIGMYRLWMSVILFMPMAWNKRRELVALSRKDIGLVLLSGLFLGLHFLFWIQSLKETSVASSMIIISLEPIFVLIGSIIVFREGASRKAVFSMGLAVFGCVVVASGDMTRGSGHLWGDLLSLIGTVAVSVYMIAGQKLRKSVSGTTYNVLVFFVAGLVLFLFNIGTRSPLFGYSGQDWLMFALLAVVSTVLGHGIFNWLLSSVAATTVSMTILGEPVGAIVLAFFLLGQPILLLQALGGAICLIGVFAFLRLNHSGKSNDEEYPPGEKTQPA
ncbi:DMT family transporter [Alicyclobacillus dauci]|uniref:DMT family transporter n=1 Tax=Alicyclobacillus dauci TaxID=1475485 RepID=A0ABY6YZP8_9BACL|nr:DMT family transporter [Alicyclobacillus dauci]WAH35934.1 DMT family transporter [Alicyclobacillus dauci]